MGSIDKGTIVGAVKIERHEQRVESLTVRPSRSLSLAQQRDIAVRILKIVIPWLVDEVADMSVLLQIPADHDHLIDAADSLGFFRAATYRDHLLRPAGRVDPHLYQLMNPNWTLLRETSTTNA